MKAKFNFKKSYHSGWLTAGITCKPGSGLPELARILPCLNFNLSSFLLAQKARQKACQVNAIVNRLLD